MAKSAFELTTLKLIVLSEIQPPKSHFSSAASIAFAILGMAVMLAAITFAAYLAIEAFLMFISWIRIFVDWLISTYEPTWQWWLGAYLLVGLLVAAISMVVGFFVIWWMASERWGGIVFVFGWIPAAIIATVGGVLLIVLWGPAFIYCFVRYN